MNFLRFLPKNAGPRLAQAQESAPPIHPLRIAGFGILVLALIAWATPPVALVGGILFALCAGNPLPRHGHALAKRLLQICVVLLGFGMDLPTILRAGWNGSVFAAATIGTTLSLGYWLGRRLSLNRNTTLLISAGTAICGGSAIAAVGTVLAVAEGEIAVAMGTVFLLNAVALYLFPWIGHALHLDPQQFGVWAGVAIHDISSVVGASMVYGNAALETATAVKLSRTLWIVPVTLGLAVFLRRQALSADAAFRGGDAGSSRPRKSRIEIPWFIGLFLLASIARSCFPAVAGWSPHISQVARWGLTSVLCMIGASLSAKAMRAVGWKAIGLGLLLWGFISVGSLVAILGLHAARP